MRKCAWLPVTPVVDLLRFTARLAVVTGFLSPNGSGKSTTALGTLLLVRRDA